MDPLGIEPRTYPCKGYMISLHHRPLRSGRELNPGLLRDRQVSFHWTTKALRKRECITSPIFKPISSCMHYLVIKLDMTLKGVEPFSILLQRIVFPLHHKVKLLAGFEPTTSWVQAKCSTAELQQQVNLYK